MIIPEIHLFSTKFSISYNFQFNFHRAASIPVGSAHERRVRDQAMPKVIAERQGPQQELRRFRNPTLHFTGFVRSTLRRGTFLKDFYSKVKRGVFAPGPHMQVTNIQHDEFATRCIFIQNGDHAKSFPLDFQWPAAGFYLISGSIFGCINEAFPNNTLHHPQIDEISLSAQSKL